MDRGVERAAQRTERIREPRKILFLGDVAGEYALDAQILGQPFDRAFLVFPQIGDNETGALTGKSLGDGVGQAPAIGNSENNGQLAFQ